MPTYEYDQILNFTLRNPGVEILEVQTPIDGESTVLVRLGLGSAQNPNARVEMAFNGLPNDGTLTTASQETIDWVDARLLEIEE